MISRRLAWSALPVGAAILFPVAAWAWPAPPDPGDPFIMSVSEVNCTKGQVKVTLRNQTRQAARYDLQLDSSSFANGSIAALKSVTRSVRVPKGGAVEIEAFSVTDSEPNTLVDSQRVRNDCRYRDHDRDRDHGWGYGRRLPYTGPPADLMGKLATGAALVLTGGIAWGLSSMWPKDAPSGPGLGRRRPIRF
ncbi:hypothetical protein [Nonomuraea sp. NPDC050310]|uniref:hypothetical protein n=1 Tax=Nonomuraea sp. NPDC050310 TaxID=3154935 RepID=UPI0033EB659A